MKKKKKYKRLTPRQRQNRDIRRGWEKSGGVKANGDPITYKQFKNRVKLRMAADGLSAKTAVSKELNSESFTSAGERSRNNFLEGIKQNFPESYKKILNLSRRGGRFASPRNNLSWSKEFRGYIIAGRYYIDVRNSPKQVNIFDIDANQRIFSEEMKSSN